MDTVYEKFKIGEKTTTILVKNDSNAMIRKRVKTTSSTRKKTATISPPPGNDIVLSTAKNAMKFIFPFTILREHNFLFTTAIKLFFS